MPKRSVVSVLILAALVIVPWRSAAPASPAQAVDPPRVRLVATGGTISNRAGGRLTAEDLVASIPKVAEYAQVEFEQFANVASSQLTLDQYLDLSKRINHLLRSDQDLAGIVVTSGTDTLEELAYFLHLTVRSEKPVVVVGAMRNPSTVGHEGPANLLDGFRVAADPAARGRGVMVVLNDEINSAREVTKTDALRLHTFQSRGYGVLGVVDDDRVVFYRDTVKRHTTRSEFDVSGITSLPRVDIVMVYQDAPGDVIKALVDLGAKGIVMATAGAGATSGTQNEGLRYAIEHGVVVVTTTRTGGGRIAPRPVRAPGAGGPDARDAAEEREEQAEAAAAGTPAEAFAEVRRRRLAGEDLLPVKARILLMLALTKTTDPAEIQRIVSEY
jgi:L-asparaginase